MSDNNTSRRPCPVQLTVRWLARLGSLVSVGFMLAWTVGQRANPFQMPTPELLLFLCWPTAVAAGIALAWFWEFGGALIAIAGLAAFCCACRFLAGSVPEGWKCAAQTAPGLLFLVSAVLRRIESRHCAAAPAKSQ